MAALGLVRARRLARAADIACAMSLEALQGSLTSFHPAIHAARPHAGPGRLGGERPRRCSTGSAILESHRWCDKVQDAYSLRCAAQVHGASRDLLDYVERTVAIEINAATDNPLVLLDEREIVSNGNFHGQPVAFALDCLAIAVAELANISERRVERMVNPSLSDGLAGVPHARGRDQLGDDDPAVRVGSARLREQGARPSGERRLDPDERRSGGPRLDGERCRAEGAAGARERRALARDRAARRRAGGRVPGAARAGARRRGRAGPRADALGAAARGPLALGRHRARRGVDPRRQRCSPRSRPPAGALA